MANNDSTNYDDKDLEALYEGVLNCEPQIFEGDAGTLSDLVFSEERVIRAWRLTAFLAGKGGDFYRELANDADKAEAFLEVPGIMTDFAELLRVVAGLANGAQGRIMVAMCNHPALHERMLENGDD